MLAFGAITTDAIMIGGSIGNVHRNAPYVIMQTLLVLTAIGTFLTTAFVAGSVHRDFETRSDALFFSLRCAGPTTCSAGSGARSWSQSWSSSAWRSPSSWAAPCRGSSRSGSAPSGWRPTCSPSASS